MNEVTIKAHTRKGKGGKVIQVKSYSRRVGRKGVRSPKRERQVLPGKEYVEMVAKKEAPKQLSPEEIARRKEVMEGFRQAREEMKSLGMTPEQYSRYKLKQQKEGKARTSLRETAVNKNLPSKKTSRILKEVRDKMSRFIEKYNAL